MRRRLTRDESREATRQAVMDAAERLFIERGYRGASLDGIAESAGFSKGDVYSNFESKGDLFLALLDRRATAEERAMASGSATTGPEQGFAWPLATLDFFVDAVRDDQLRDALAGRYRAARQSGGANIASGRPRPAWASWEEIATVAMALGSGLIIQSATEPEAVPSDLLGRAMERLMRD